MTAIHRIRWYGVTAGIKVPRNRFMLGKDWGWDVICSCGWESRTGGAIEACIRRAITEHKSDVAYCAENGHAHHPATAPCCICGLPA